MSAGFIGVGLLTIWFAMGWWSRESRSARLIVASLTVLGLALMVMAVPPNPAAVVDWHNLVYPAIPISWVCFVLAHISFSRGDPRWGCTAKISKYFVLPAFLVSLLSTRLDAVAQLARFSVFAIQMGWIVVLAIRQIAILRRDS